MRKRRDNWVTMTAVLALLAGCVDTSVPPALPTAGRIPKPAGVPKPNETVRGEEEPAVVTLDLGSKLRERRLTQADAIPSSVLVPPTNLSGVPVAMALQAVLAGTDVALSWNTKSFEDHLVTVVNLSGPLPRVIEKICSSAKVFCDYRHGTLELSDKETFIIELPAALQKLGASGSGSTSNSMADAIGALAGDKGQIDTQGGNIIYTTDVEGQERVHGYLDQLRNNRPLVIMQLYIWEVTLNSENGTGINWSNFGINNMRMFGNMENLLLSGSTGFSSFATPSVSLGAKLSGHVSAESVLEFLATQGRVQTISNPQLTFVSGSSAEFKVGGKQTYISQIGQSTTSVSGSSSSNGIGTNTVSTSTIDTGLGVTVNGAYEGGVISAMLDLELEDVIGLNPTCSTGGSTCSGSNGGQIIDLPITTERKVSTSLRIRPGDNLVLAGLVTSKDTNSHEGVPMPFNMQDLSTFKDSQLMNNELVIMVKPSVVLFSDSGRGDRPDFKTMAHAEEHGKGILVEPGAVVIDKDGTRSMMSGEVIAGSAPVAPTSLQPSETTRAPAPVALPLLPTPAQPSVEVVPMSKTSPSRILEGHTTSREDVQTSSLPEAASTLTETPTTNDGVVSQKPEHLLETGLAPSVSQAPVVLAPVASAPAQNLAAAPASSNVSGSPQASATAVSPQTLQHGFGDALNDPAGTPFNPEPSSTGNVP